MVAQVSYTGCARKGEHNLKMFVEEINRAGRVNFPPHEIDIQKKFLPPHSSILLHFGLSCICCSHNANPKTGACAQ
jgi:hypothetical protein